jgi:hypothetical protein
MTSHSEQSFFGLRLIIKHPKMDPKEISRELKTEASAAVLAGTSRFTPTGTPLPGLHKNSVWTRVEYIVGLDDFVCTLKTFLSKLEGYDPFIQHVIETGGYVELSLNLPGKHNVRGAIPWQFLSELGKKRISFGVEVFPDWRNVPYSD